jgi:molybdenum cofactor cytidylyltransferase
VLSGIVLAAGNSTRMGTPKALLTTTEGQLFVSHIVRTWHAAGVHNVIFLIGRD